MNNTNASTSRCPRKFTVKPKQAVNASSDILLSSPLFDLVTTSGVGRNGTPWYGMEVVSKGLAKKWVVEIRLNYRGLPNWDAEPEDAPDGIKFDYNGCYVNYGLRMRVDTHIEEFIEVLQAAKDFKDQIDRKYNFKTHYLD